DRLQSLDHVYDGHLADLVALPVKRLSSPRKLKKTGDIKTQRDLVTHSFQLGGHRVVGGAGARRKLRLVAASLLPCNPPAPGRGPPPMDHDFSWVERAAKPLTPRALVL